MSDFVLQYDLLESIAKRSNSLGRQADDYANSLTSRVAKAITSVTGSSSGYLEDASYYVNEKVGKLQKKAQEFYDFASQVTILAETATRVDEEVQNLLAESKEEFLQHHESLRIDDWKADILNWLVGIKNKLPFLEVLGNILSAVNTLLETCLDSIKYWYYCEGGKYIVGFVASIALAVLAVTLFVVALSTFAAVAVAAGGFVAICGAIGAGIAAVNATTNVATSLRAANTACNGDPTWARIYSKQNTLSEVIRETNFNNGTLNGLSYLGADLIDATEMFCDIVCIVEIGKSIPKLFAKKNFNIFKKGSFHLEDFKTSIKKSFADTKEGIKKGFTDLKGNVKEGYTYVKNNIKNGIIGKVDVDEIAVLNKVENVSVNGVDDILAKGGSNSTIITDEIKQALITGEDKAYFWSGLGKDGANITKDTAIKKGCTTLENQIEVNNIKMPEWSFLDKNAQQAWRDVSDCYAQNCSGNINVVLGDKVGANSVFISTEVDALKANVNVKSITAINPLTNEIILIYDRLNPENNATIMKYIGEDGAELVKFGGK
jgi:hypothetical protein